jgi:hypothetical protein
MARGRLSRLRSRLAALPGFFRDLPSTQRRRVLLAGALAGLVAMVSGLIGVTGIELAGGKNLSCLVWSECPTTDTTSGESSGGSGLSILGGYTGTGSTPSVNPSGEQQNNTPGNYQSDQQAPRQPSGQPVQSDPGKGTPQQPAGTPQQDSDPAQPDADGGVEPSPQSGKAPEKG